MPSGVRREPTSLYRSRQYARRASGGACLELPNPFVVAAAGGEETGTLTITNSFYHAGQPTQLLVSIGQSCSKIGAARRS